MTNMEYYDWIDWRVRDYRDPVTGVKYVYVTHIPTNLTAKDIQPKIVQRFITIRIPLSGLLGKLGVTKRASALSPPTFEVEDIYRKAVIILRKAIEDSESFKELSKRQ